MVFLIQKSQNKDSKAIHEGTSNHMVDVEDLTEEELDSLHKFYIQLSCLAHQEDSLIRTHSIDAAEENHQMKASRYQDKRSSKKPGSKSITGN
jgi:low affinity Fe/Cu permease